MNRSLPAPYGRHLAGGQHDELTEGRSRLTLRGFWVGAFLSFFLSMGAPYANMAMRATNMAFDFNTPGAIFLFLVLVGLLNTLFKLAARDFRFAVGLALLATGGFGSYWISRGAVDWYSPGFWFGAFLALSAVWNVPVVQRGGTLALNRAELVLVYVMLLVVSALCTMGLTQQLLPALTGIFYYASPANQWAEKLFPLFPAQRVLVDDGAGNRGFYESGFSICSPRSKPSSSPYPASNPPANSSMGSRMSRSWPIRTAAASSPWWSWDCGLGAATCGTYGARPSTAMRT